MKSWLLAARPKTLTAAIVPVLVGSVLAWSQGFQFSLPIFFSILFSALFIQIATNFFNDAIDFKKGTDTEHRLGPTRVSQSGLLDAEKVLRAGVLCAGLAILFAVPILLKGGVVILAIGVASLLFAYLYTGGPAPLAYIGAGELFVVLFFGLVAVSGTHYLYSRTFDEWTVLAGLQLGLLCTLLLSINNYRDIYEDRKNSKRTLAARFGEKFARTEIILIAFLPFFLQFVWIFYHYQSFKGFLFLMPPFLALPLALNLSYQIYHSRPSRELNKLLAQSALLHLVFGILLSISFVIEKSQS